MENPSLYISANTLQKIGTTAVIEKHKRLINWRPDGEDTILDVGCGPGDVTFDYVLSILPKEFKKLHAVDISDKLIGHAKEVYAHPKITFGVLDFSMKIPDTPKEQYDHLFSNYCLHWVKNQELAIRNVYNLLKSGGDCLMTIVTEFPIYNVFLEARKIPKFAQYCHDAEQYVSTYHQRKDPKKFVENLLHSTGFCGYLVEAVEPTFDWNAEIVKNIFHSLDPFVHRMPKGIQNEYMDFFIRKYLEHQKVEYIDDKQPVKFHYKYLTIYARK